VSCWTAYLVRDEDGARRMAVAKYGTWMVTEPAERDGLLAFLRDRAVPLDEVADEAFGDVYCRGVAIDLPGRRFRCYPCYGEPVPFAELEHTLRTAEAWNGWDVGVAIGGREDFPVLLPGVSRVVRPYGVLDGAPVTPDPVPHDEAWFAGWDPQTLTLTVRHDPDSANWTTEQFDLVTVVEPDLTGRHFRLGTIDTHPVHPLLAWLRDGPAAIERLAAGVPFPPAYDDNVRTAIVVDRSQQVIQYWMTNLLVPARLLSAVRAAWPGWQLRPIAPGGDGVTAGHQVRWPAITVSQGPT
jgi:hypothetical protein